MFLLILATCLARSFVCESMDGLLKIYDLDKCYFDGSAAVMYFEKNGQLFKKWFSDSTCKHPSSDAQKVVLPDGCFIGEKPETVLAYVDVPNTKCVMDPAVVPHYFYKKGCFLSTEGRYQLNTLIENGTMVMTRQYAADEKTCSDPNKASNDVHVYDCGSCKLSVGSSRLYMCQGDGLVSETNNALVSFVLAVLFILVVV
mgnify:CR=1 FL=1